MNASEKIQVRLILSKLRSMRDELDLSMESLDRIHSRVCDQFDNMSEATQESERGAALNEECEYLETARAECEIGNVTEAIDALENLQLS